MYARTYVHMVISRVMYLFSTGGSLPSLPGPPGTCSLPFAPPLHNPGPLLDLEGGIAERIAVYCVIHTCQKKKGFCTVYRTKRLVASSITSARHGRQISIAQDGKTLPSLPHYNYTDFVEIYARGERIVV